jgi:hypothetical protein
VLDRLKICVLCAVIYVQAEYLSQIHDRPHLVRGRRHEVPRSGSATSYLTKARYILHSCVNCVYTADTLISLTVDSVRCPPLICQCGLIAYFGLCVTSIFRRHYLPRGGTIYLGATTKHVACLAWLCV